jgi:dihydroflavonol-4-reductase
LVRSSADLKPIDGLDVEIIEGDVNDFKSLLNAFEGAKIVFHLAGMVSIMPDDDLIYKVNVEGTRNVVKACVETGVRRLVYTSSVHALKEPPHGTVIDENCPYEPEASRGDYDRSKAMASLEIIKGVENGLDAVMILPSGIMGPCDYNISQMGHLITNYIRGDMKAYMDGAYDFVDVRDVAKGIILACKYGKPGESYLLSGEKITVKELLILLEKLTGKKQPFIKIPLWLAKAAGKLTPTYYRAKKTKPLFTSYSAEVLCSNCNINSDKARLELGYSTRPLEKTIKDTVEWFQKNPEIYKNST